jgi:hypothetical protein
LYIFEWIVSNTQPDDAGISLKIYPCHLVLIDVDMCDTIILGNIETAEAIRVQSKEFYTVVTSELERLKSIVEKI